MSRFQSLLWIASALLAALLVAACGNSTSSAQSTSSSSSSAPAAPAALDVTGTEYKFAHAASVRAGLVTTNFKNAGATAHQAVLTRLDAGHTVQEAVQSFSAQGGSGPIPGWLHFTGGAPNIDPGKASSTTQRLTAGHYMFICLLRGQGPGGVPHYAQGMVSELSVTGDAGSASQSQSATAVTAHDFSYTVPALHAGSQTLTVRNQGNEVHEFTLARLAPGATADQIKAAFASHGPPTGPPPFSLAGGAAPFDPGDGGNAVVDLQPGNYAFVCFVHNRSGGPPHAIANGMITAFTVSG